MAFNILIRLFKNVPTDKLLMAGNTILVNLYYLVYVDHFIFLQITTNTKMQGPKITITRVPTIDQSDMDYLYPIPEPEIVKSESPPESSVKMELNGYKISSSTKDCSTNTPEIVIIFL